MFETRRVRSKGGAALGMMELIYHSVVRNVRKTHGNALVGLIMSMMQAVMFVATFYLMFSILGLRGLAIRGDFLIYIMSGIFVFLTHTKALQAVVGSEGPASAMMKHAPMNTIIAISGAALSALYLQTLTLITILFVYHVAITPVEIDRMIPAFGMYLAGWFSGVGIGMVFLAAKPWSPGTINMIVSIYSRANMLASGKMFVANQLPPFMLAMFSWNPLFHCIDQTRGFAFINYTPHNSSWSYPIYVALALMMVGLMGEFYTRKHASASWGARA
ncbi:MAG: ABC transporter permease [Shimia sp.]